MQKLDPKSTSEWISSGGPLEKTFPSFEERSSQIELLQQVCIAFNENKIGVFEAGTGVGKSFAYLIPSILWADANKERVVISTGTINLQQQLFEKDIPSALNILQKNVKAVLLKGRQHFICLRRLNDALNETEKDMFSADLEELQQIFKWTTFTASGSDSDLPFMPKSSLWEHVNSESDGCMGRHCSFYENCFVMKARKEAADAGILVVNHHLLFADIEMRLKTGFEDTAVLPPYTRLIFDEAHGIENAATSFFSETITMRGLAKQLNALYRMQKTARAGLLFGLETLSSKTESVQDAIAEIQLIKAHILDLEDAALKLDEISPTWRFCAQTEPLSCDVLHCIQVLKDDIGQLCAAIKNLIDGIKDEDMTVPGVWEAKKILRRLEGAELLFKNFYNWQEQIDKVFWIEKKYLHNAKKWTARFIQTPLEIASMMNSGVFKPLSTVICTSATLTISGSFDFWLRRSGLLETENSRICTMEFSSPFNFQKNLLFSIPLDLPLPYADDFQAHVEYSLIRLIRASQGRALVLFTAYDSLRSACEQVRSALAREGIKLYRQGDDDRFRLLEAFKTDSSSVLFATDSFWEGIDVPGESLSHVIIVKLPFSVPTDPVFAVRSEAIERCGESSFMTLSLPEAVIKFRQGFGRLIRHSDDRGAVTVLDKRLIEKRYGSLFLSSIPQSKGLYESLDTVCTSINRFLDL